MKINLLLTILLRTHTLWTAALGIVMVGQV